MTIIEYERRQCYTWCHPNGTRITWDITLAIELTRGKRPPAWLEKWSV